MKLIIIAFAVLVGIWIFRRGRNEEAIKRKEERRRIAIPQDMVECAVCGLHLPRADAVLKGDASFCSAAHLQSAKG